MPSLPRYGGRRPAHRSQWKIEIWPDVGPVFGILLMERILHHRIDFCRRRSPHNSLRPCRASARARAFSPFPSPGSMLRSSKARRGGFFVSPALAHFQPGGRHRAPPTTPSNIKRGGRGRSSRTTSGETALTGFLYKVVQYSFHQPLRSCQFVSCPGAGCKLELLHVQCVFEHPCASSIGSSPSRRDAGTDEAMR